MAAPSRNKAKVAGSSFFLFCIALFLTSYSAKNPWTNTIGTSAGSLVLQPFQIVFDSGYSAVSNFWSHYIGLISVRRENEALHERLAALEAQNSKLMELESENARLAALLGVREAAQVRGVAAHVIGHDPSNWIQMLTLDVGESEGIMPGIPVLEGNGVVGQVAAVGGSTSRVLLITDHSSGIDAIIQGSRVRGVLEGSGKLSQLSYVLSDEEVKLGDRVITSGMDGVFPKGMLLGVVSSVDATKKIGGMFQSIEVKPAVDFSKLENVLLVTATNPSDGDALKTKATTVKKSGEKQPVSVKAEGVKKP